MKKITFLIITFLFLSAYSFCQRTYKVNEEVSFFDGVNWVESQVIKVENDNYFVYTDREKTKTKWCTASDLEPFHTEAEISEIKIDLVETRYMPVYKEMDIVKYKSGEDWIQSEIVKVGEESQYQIYSDTSKTNLIIVLESDLIMLKSTGESDYKTIKKDVSYIYKVGENVEFFQNEIWNKGQIEKFNKEKQVFINNVWYASDKIRKISN